MSSAFDSENAWPVLLIMIMRLYDLNLAFLSAIDETKAQQIRELHESGQTFAPAPKFVEYVDDDEIPESPQ